MTNKPDVLYINRGARLAGLDNGEFVPVTHWFDGMGEDCDPDIAASCVAGSEKTGWYSIDLRNFVYATVH